MQKCDVEIKCQNLSGKSPLRATEIAINGIQIPCVKGFNIQQQAQGVSTLTIELYFTDLQLVKAD